MDIRAKIALTRQLCLSGLQMPPLSGLAEDLERGEIIDKRPIALLRSVLDAQNRKSQLLSICRRLGADPELALNKTASLVRVLLLKASLVSLEKLKEVPVDDSVRALICDEFQFFAQPGPKELHLLQPETYSLLALGKIALLERFPAGQYHWEISGLPRSWLFQVPPLFLPRVLYFVATQLRGFRPCFFPHMATRRNPLVMQAKTSNKSWYRIARSVELQPAIKGLVACSWLHSVDTFAVSPHLSFMNEPFVESGAIVTTIGEAGKQAGFLVGSDARRKLYESGKFKPTLGLVLWSRAQMIRWAHSHPELGK